MEKLYKAASNPQHAAALARRIEADARLKDILLDVLFVCYLTEAGASA